MKQEGRSKSSFSLNSPSKTQSSSRNIFDPLRHQKPKFDANGTEIDCFYSLDAQNILTHKENIRIPSNWKNSANTARTYTELAWNRRKANLPDKSFDLNGDGTISFKEYAISKMFDFDLDGKLSSAEKDQCLKKLKEGFESIKISF